MAAAVVDSARIGRSVPTASATSSTTASDAQVTPIETPAANASSTPTTAAAACCNPFASVR